MHAEPTVTINVWHPVVLTADDKIKPNPNAALSMVSVLFDPSKEGPTLAEVKKLLLREYFKKELDQFLYLTGGLFGFEAQVRGEMTEIKHTETLRSGPKGNGFFKKQSKDVYTINLALQYDETPLADIKQLAESENPLNALESLSQPSQVPLYKMPTKPKHKMVAVSSRDISHITKIDGLYEDKSSWWFNAFHGGHRTMICEFFKTVHTLTHCTQ